MKLILFGVSMPPNLPGVLAPLNGESSVFHTNPNSMQPWHEKIPSV